MCQSEHFLLAECLHAQKQFKMQSQLAAKEAKTQLKIDAHRIINERTTTARKTNKLLRDKVIKHIDETKGNSYII